MSRPCIFIMWLLSLSNLPDTTVLCRNYNGLLCIKHICSSNRILARRSAGLRRDGSDRTADEASSILRLKSMREALHCLICVCVCDNCSLEGYEMANYIRRQFPSQFQSHRWFLQFLYFMRFSHHILCKLVGCWSFCLFCLRHAVLDENIWIE